MELNSNNLTFVLRPKPTIDICLGCWYMFPCRALNIWFYIPATVDIYIRRRYA
jgi:hypothetical protein